VRSLFNAYQYTLLKAENFKDVSAFRTFLDQRARFDDFFAEMKKSPPQRSTAAYIHGDYHPGNILFAGDQIKGIVDFDYLAYGPRLYDIAYSLTMFQYNGPEDSDERFIAGYNSDAKVAIDLEHPDLRKYRRVASLLNIAWLVNQVEPKGKTPDDVNRALAKAELMLSRIS
jgi:Ser/Thr protein kinase RdoA (MazF antagonist)